MKKSNTSNKSITSITGKKKTCITCSTCNTLTTFTRGQSLFELVVAIAISALVIVAMVSLATNSIKNSNYSRNKALAASYAQQTTEWLRGQRDSAPDSFFVSTQTPSWCLPTLAFTKPIAISSNCTDVISDTVFRRWVSFTTSVPAGKNVVEADVTVSWTDSGGIHEVRSTTNFSDWRQR